MNDPRNSCCPWLVSRAGLGAGLEFQTSVWDSYLAGKNGLIHSATGTGKTYAAWMAPLAEWLDENHRQPGLVLRRDATPLRVLW